MKQSNEPIWWGIFSAGGVMSALFMPALIVTTGFILPFMVGGDAAAYEAVNGTVSFWLVRLALLGVIAVSCFHCAHRIKHILIDLGLRHAGPILPVGCYGCALVGAVIAGIVLLMV